MNLNLSSTTSNLSKESAVIVLLEQATNSLVLTQRSANLRDHPGEVCFPGGRWQAGDADFWLTALRELKEELGVDSQRVTPIQELQREKTLNGSTIHPWLATISMLEPYTVNQREVAAVFTLPMREVRVITNYKEVVVERYGRIVKSCQFTASDYFIWGATARIMKQLCLTEWHGNL